MLSVVIKSLISPSSATVNFINFKNLILNVRPDVFLVLFVLEGNDDIKVPSENLGLLNNRSRLQF